MLVAYMFVNVRAVIALIFAIRTTVYFFIRALFDVLGQTSLADESHGAITAVVHRGIRFSSFRIIQKAVWWLGAHSRMTILLRRFLEIDVPDFLAGMFASHVNVNVGAVL